MQWYAFGVDSPCLQNGCWPSLRGRALPLIDAHRMEHSAHSSATQEKTISDVRVIGLGAAEIWLGSRAVTPTTDVLYAVLLFLAVQHPRPVAANALLQMIWPNIDEPRRRHSLRQLVYRIRRFGCSVSTNNGTLKLDVDSVSADFDRTVSAEWAEQASLAEVRDATTLFAEFSPSFSQPFAEWLDRLRADVGTRARDACLERIRVTKSHGRWSDVDEWARLCLQSDSLNEEATLARAEAMAMRGSKLEAQSLLTEYVLELGDSASTVGLPARVLRRRISELAETRRFFVPDGSFGREREFSLLTDSASIARQGRSIATFVHGPAGTGKTLLLDQFATFCETQGFSLIRVQVVRDLHGTSGSLLTDVLRAALQLPGALACSPEHLACLREIAENSTTAPLFWPSKATSRNIDSIGTAVSSLFRELEVEKPLALVLDDYLASDTASLTILSRATAAMNGCRLLLVVSAREHPPQSPLISAAQEIRDLHLGTLSRDATMRFAVSAAAIGGTSLSEEDLENIYTATGGHPLFVREIATSRSNTYKTYSLPQNLEAIIWASVRDLSSSAQRLLSLLSILHGSEGSEDSLLLTDLQEPDCEIILIELTTAGLLPTAGSLRLKPCLAVSLAVRARLSPTILSSLHFRAGCVLERKAILSDSAACAREAARHLGLAREGERAARLLSEAAARQIALGNSSEAADLLQGAARSANSELTRLQCKLAELGARRLTGDWEGVAALCCQLSRDTRKRVLQPTDLLDVYLTSLEADMHRGSSPRLTMARSADVMTEKQYPHDRRERAANLTATLASNLGDRQHLSAALNALPLESATEGRDSFDRQLVHIIAEHDLGSLEKAKTQAQRLVSRARISGSVEVLVRALLAASVPERSSGDLDTTVALLREAHAECESHQLWSLATRCADTLSGVLFDSEDLEQAQKWQEVADSTCRSVFSHWTNRTVVHQRLRLSAHSQAHATFDHAFLSDYTQVVFRDELAMRRNHDLAALAMLALRHQDTAALKPIVDELLAGIVQCRGQRRVDYILAAAIAGARALGQEFKSRRAAVAFCDEYRNSPFPPLWYLEATLVEDRQRLFRFSQSPPVCQKARSTP